MIQREGVLLRQSLIRSLGSVGATIVAATLSESVIVTVITFSTSMCLLYAVQLFVIMLCIREYDAHARNED
jgi:Sec-independent protein secretion pathway component TatC